MQPYSSMSTDSMLQSSGIPEDDDDDLITGLYMNMGMVMSVKCIVSAIMSLSIGIPRFITLYMLLCAIHVIYVVFDYL